MKKILFIVGSLRKDSFNKQLAQHIEHELEGKASISYLDFSDLPLFNQDIELPVLPEVDSLRQQVLEADALWLFSPVYNQTIPGTVKNLLDWLSRPIDPSKPGRVTALANKPIAVTSVASSGHPTLFELYQKLLPYIKTKVVGEMIAVKIVPEMWKTGKLVLSDETAQALQDQAQLLLED